MPPVDAPLARRTAEQAAESEHVPDWVWDHITGFLEKLRAHDDNTYRHSLRVGFYAHGVAAARDGSAADRRLALYAGLMHDVGKVAVPADLLHDGPITTAEFETIKKHPEESYHILRSTFPLTAVVAGLHHRVGSDGYGITVRTATGLPSRKARLAVRSARVVFLADYFDAAATRTDRGPRRDDGTLRERMQQAFPGHEAEVSWLVENKISE